jgi:bifunctional DNA-binding transcriptional regulator/antitoxin component of YhaV-PrlF toxin-antitoxin module
MAYRPNSKQKKVHTHVKFPKSHVVSGGLPIKVTGTLSVANKTNKNDDIFVYPKSEGRVTVPASALKKIGAKPGSKVSLTKANGHITILNDGGKFGHDTYTVDKHTSIRIRKHRVAGFKRFKVSVEHSSKKPVVFLDGEK